jgi:hypothetical protein
MSQPCEGCQSTLRKTQLLSAGAGLVIGAAAVYVLFRFTAKK